MIHKVERDFCIQLGDPTDAQNGQNPKNGHSIFHQMHGEGARYFEAQTLPRILHDRPGLVSMINNGKDKFGSQVRYIERAGVKVDGPKFGKVDVHALCTKEIYLESEHITPDIYRFESSFINGPSISVV